MAGNLKKKKKIDNFTQINNDFLRNKNLSWKAKGLLCYLMSHSEEYEVRKKNLQNFATDGYDSTDSAFKELESNGYIKTVGTGRDKNGAFIGFDYEFDDEPLFISETHKKNEKRDSEQIEPIGITRRGSPVAAHPSRETRDKEEQVIPTISSNNKEEQKRSLNINTETSSVGDLTSLLGEVKKPMTIYQKFVDIWLKEFRIGWKFTATDGKKMKEMIKNINRTLSQSMAYHTEQDSCDLFRKFLSELPEFYKKETLSVLESKYDSIVEQIKSISNGQTSISGSHIVSRFSTNGFSVDDPRLRFEEETEL